MFTSLYRVLCCLLVSMLFVLPASAEKNRERPDDIVRLDQVAPDILQELRYTGNDNFTGRPVAGYAHASCLLTNAAAQALKKGQAQLRQHGLSFIVFDCYRPTRAVADFLQWSRQPDDKAMKAAFYPHVDKKDFFALGYVAERSGHSRASTVDLGVVLLHQDKTFTLADFGTGFDFMDERSWVDATQVSDDARANRKRLSELMDDIGFKGYDKEWWHFTLRDEPYPDTYFDFLPQ